MKSRLKKSVIKVAYFAALIFTGNALAQTQGTANVKLLLEVQNMRQEIAVLRNKVEKQGYLIRELQQARGERIGAEIVANASVSPTFPVVVSEVQGSQASVTTPSNSSELGEISSNIPPAVNSSELGGGGAIDFPLQPGAVNAASNVEQQTVATQVSNAPAVQSRQSRLLEEGDNAIKTDLGEVELYNKGIEKLRSQEYKSAASIFSAQLQNHPKGSKAGDGYFWLAETFYILNDLDSSAKSYESLFSLFPDHIRAPKALFKLIKVYLEKDDKVAAKSTLGKLVSLYPTSKEAVEANSLYRDLL